MRRPVTFPKVPVAAWRERTPGDFVMAVNVPPLPLDSGRQYSWQLTIDGTGRDDWRLPFAIRPAAPD